MAPELDDLPGNVYWLTGLSGAGKTTISLAGLTQLRNDGMNVVVLDGDVLRLGLCRDLGFSARDRRENVRRTAEVARLMADAGLIVIVALISPFRVDREMARDLVGQARFHEIYLAASIEVCEARDVKGLYAKARRGEIVGFTGISSPYEQPEKPDLILETTAAEEECVARFVAYVRGHSAGKKM